MYMRLVQARYMPASLSIIRKIYDEKIIPELRKMKGCLFACLIRSDTQPDEGVSFTLWDSQENAESYVKSGAFQSLLAELKPYMSDSSEWKVELTKDLKVEYKPVPEEPVIKSYRTLIESSNEISAPGAMYMRIVSLNIQPGKFENFQEIYTNEIIPVLKKVEGCRYVYLTGSDETITRKKELIILLKAELVPTLKDRFAHPDTRNIIQSQIEKDRDRMKYYKLNEISFDKDYK